MSAVPKPAKRSPKEKRQPPRTPVKKRNPARRKSEFARCYHSRKRVAWVKRQPCVICLQWPCDNAHIENGGAGRKANYDKIVPLCCISWPVLNGPGYERGHHGRLHDIGVRVFEACYNVNLALLAAETEKAWLAESGE